MNIKDLKAREGNVEIIAEVIEKSPVRTFDKFGKKGTVCNAKIKDSTDTITLTLWNEDVEKVNVGDKIKLTNGYVGEWQGERQLSAGKFGKIEVIEKGTGAPPKQEKVLKNFEEQEELGDSLSEEDESEDAEEEFI